MRPESPPRAEGSAFRSFFRGLGQFRRAWPQFVAADLATRVAATLLLTPVVLLVARAALARSGGGAVTDLDILRFALTPLGIATLLLLGGGSIVAGLVGHTAIMAIAAGVREDRAVSWLTGMRLALRRFLGIFELAVRALLRLIVDAAPWLIGAGVVYFLLLTDHDINFYLQEKPPRFWVAGALITAALLGLLGFVLRRLLGWSIALPRLLFGGTSPAGALRASAEATKGRRLRALVLFALWGVATFGLAAIVTFAAGWLGRWLIPAGEVGLPRMAGAIAIAALVAGLGNLLVSVVSSIVLAVSVFELDRAWAEPWQLPKEVKSEPGTLGARARLAVPRWGWILVALAVPAGVLYLAVRMLDDVGTDRPVEITAHRGASGRAPENTLAAFRAAIEDGADMMELDVQETSDGVVVVHHDADFLRVAKDPRKIWETPWDAVAQIPNGAWYGPEFGAERVAALEDVLRLAKGRIRVNIELKTYGHGQRLEARVVEIVERLEMADEVVLMSLDRPTVETLKRLRPAWTIGLLATVSLGDLTRLDADFLALNAAKATASLVKRAHENGKKVYVWTVNHPAQMSAMISLGVDGLITDEPALARDVLKQRAEMSPVERLLVSAGAAFGIVVGAAESSTPDDA